MCSWRSGTLIAKLGRVQLRWAKRVGFVIGQAIVGRDRWG